MANGGGILAPSAMADNSGKTLNVAAKMWARHDNAYFGCDEAVHTLPAGMYTIEANPQQGIYFKNFTPDLDDLLSLDDSASENVYNHVEKFWRSEESYRRFNVVWKRGIMLWGPPGSGKTTCVHMVAKAVIDRGGIAVFIKEPNVAHLGLQMFRRIEPERPVVVIMEDIDAIVGRHGEAELLALLDGELQIQKVLYIATTNYPEKLDPRLMNRPSRFDVVQLIKMPSELARRQYLSAKLPSLEQRPSRDVMPDRDTLLEQFKTLQTTLRNLDLKLVAEKKAIETMDVIEQLEATSGKSLTQTEHDRVSKQIGEIKQMLDTENAKARTLLDEWVKDTEGFSIAHIKELMLCVEGIGADYDLTIKRLKKMNTSRVTSRGMAADEMGI